MKQSKSHFFNILTPLILCVPALQAASAVEVPWADLCLRSNGREIAVTTVKGTTPRGHCLEAEPDQLTIGTWDIAPVIIPRAEVSGIRIRREKSHLKDLGFKVGNGIAKGIGGMFFLVCGLSDDSDDNCPTPLDTLKIPVWLGWGGIASPYNAVLDVKTWIRGWQEVKVI